MVFDPTKVNAARALERNQRPLPASVYKKPAGEFKKGLRAGTRQLGSIAEGIAGATNEMIGREEAAQKNLESSNQLLQEAAVVGPRVKQIEEIDSATDLKDWAAGMFGQVLPVMAPMVAGGPVGLGARTLARSAISKKAATIGGAALGSAGTETGLIFNELQNTESDLTGREKVLTAIGFGLPAGGLDILPVVQVFNKFGVGKAAKRTMENSLMKDVAKGAGQSAVLEGTTEGIQTILERSAVKFADENFEVFGEEGMSELANAVAAGFTVGAGFGSVGSGAAALTNAAPSLGTDTTSVDSKPGPGIFSRIESKMRDLEADEELIQTGFQKTVGSLRKRLFGVGREDMVAELDEVMQQAPGATTEEKIKFQRDIEPINAILDVMDTMTPEQKLDVPSESINKIAAYINAPTDVGYDLVKQDAELLFGKDAQKKITKIRDQLIGVKKEDVNAFFSEDSSGLSRAEEVAEASISRERENEEGEASSSGQVGFEIDRGRTPKYIHRRTTDGLEINRKEDLYTAATAHTAIRELTGAEKSEVGVPIQEITGHNKDGTPIYGSSIYTIIPAREGIVERNKAVGTTLLDPVEGKDKYVIKQEQTAISENNEPERQLSTADLADVASPEQIRTGNVVHRNKIRRRFNKESDIEDKLSHFKTGDKEYINIPSLTKTMIRKAGSGSANNSAIAEAFLNGFVSLIVDHNYSAKQLIGQLHKGRIIFYRGTGKNAKAIKFGTIAKGTKIKEKMFVKLRSSLAKLSEQNKAYFVDELAIEDKLSDNEELAGAKDDFIKTGFDEELDQPIGSRSPRPITARESHETQFVDRATGKPDPEQVARAKQRREKKKNPKLSGKSPTFTRKKKSRHKGRMVQLFNQTTKLLGLEGLELLDTVNAKQWAFENKQTELRTSLQQNSIHGFNAENVIYVNPALSERDQFATLAHELGHVVYKDMFSKLDTSKPTYKAIMNEYITWVNAQEDDKSVLKVLASRGAQVIKIHNAWKTVGDITLEDLSASEKEYVLHFEEWFADQLSVYMRDESVVPATKGQTAVKTFALRMKAVLAKLITSLNPTDAPQTHRFFNALIIARQSRGYRAHVSQIVNKINFSREINTAGKRGKRANNVLLTQAMQQSPYSIESLSHVAELFAKQLTTKEKATLNRALSRKTTKDKIEEIIDSANLPLDVYHAVAFQLWMDNKLLIGPETKSIFHRLLDIIRKILGTPSDDHLARAILIAVANGGISKSSRDSAFVGPHKPKEKNFNLSDVGTSKIRKTRAAQVVFDAMEKVIPMIKVYGFTADSNMRNKNPIFASIADVFHARVGLEGVNRTYFEERTQMRGRFDDILQHALDPLTTDADIEKVFTAAQRGYDPTGLNDVQKTALANIRGLFKEVGRYLHEAKVLTKPNPKSYFPRIYDYDYTRNNKDAFIAMLNSKKEYSVHMDKYAHALHALEEKHYGVGNGTPINTLRADMPERIYGWIMANDGNVENIITTSKQITVEAGFMNMRKFGWLKDKDLQPFMSTDFNYIMSSYIDKAVKTAAFQRRFKKGEIDQLIDKARKLGATDEDVEQALDMVNAMIGRAGLKNNRKLHRLFGLTAPPGQVINPTLQQVMSTIIVARNLMVLGLATFTSLVDPLGILVRSGDFDTAWKSLKTGGNEIRRSIKNLYAKEKEQKTEATLLAQTLGTIDIYTTQAALEWEYGGTYMTGPMKRINEGFFKVIGLTQWTQLTRTMATTGAIDFIKKHANGDYNKNSMRYLKQLNLVPQDLTFDDQGNLVLLKHADLLDATSTERARDARVKNAINRFVDEAILRPNAAQRPIWASDPHWMLVFHLQSFMYSFHDRILRRVYTEYKDHKNIVPAIMLMSFPMMMLAVNDLRDKVKYLGNDNPRKVNWGFYDHFFEAMDRSGIPGVAGAMILSAKTDIEYGGFGWETRLGVFGNTSKNILRSRPLVSDISNLMPLQSVWKNWDQ